ncbi:geminin coiled-coil domain-containing protein 1 [Paroedura picta]|uniref:geminin coiled-coil domain-containing protein 1 n=1 Tax=Paroedura picta TaxID=143630 RepID=UPI00405748B0
MARRRPLGLSCLCQEETAYWLTRGLGYFPAQTPGAPPPPRLAFLCPSSLCLLLLLLLSAAGRFLRSPSSGCSFALRVTTLTAPSAPDEAAAGGVTRGNSTRLELASRALPCPAQWLGEPVAGAHGQQDPPPTRCAAPCGEPPPAFAGGSVCARPWPDPTAAAAAAEAKVAAETWLEPAWAEAAAGILEPPAAHAEERGGDHWGDLYFGPVDEVGQGDQLCTQIFRNKQLQDTLLQKEEQLAQLRAENRHLKQFLNSALVKQLEEKAKKLLWHSGWGACGAFKRPLRAEGPSAPREPPRAPKARRSLLGDLSACEERPPAEVDVWVLRTLGLKDIDTIDESASANYSAGPLDPARGSFLQGPTEATKVDIRRGQPGVDRWEALAPLDGARKGPLPPGLQLLSPSPRKDSPLAPCSLPGGSDHVLPVTPPVAFTTSLSPHCNVKTHTFRQGQAFVRRDQDGGWKLTWVPKKTE